MTKENAIKILHISGPFREPREPVFSYDYSIQRPMWPMPHAARVKVGIATELDVLRGRLLGATTGTPGQQLVISQLLTREIADEKLRIAEQDGVLSARADVVVPPFTGSQAHLFERLESWFEREQDRLRAEIRQRVKL